jgi:hypothetical protein
MGGISMDKQKRSKLIVTFGLFIAEAIIGMITLSRGDFITWFMVVSLNPIYMYLIWVMERGQLVHLLPNIIVRT